MNARATVIIPTYGDARFIIWPLKSVQQQTVKEIEICIICDGSPPDMVDYLREISKDDPRISIYIYPKSPRHGEIYRDEIIKKTSGEIICYCSHDDLWLPNHIETVEKELKNACFTNTIHAAVMGDQIKEGTEPFWFSWRDISDAKEQKVLLDGQSFISLTFGAHTRKAYLELEEGWTTTPINKYTDWYMWRKFVSSYPCKCTTAPVITSLNLRKSTRTNYNEQQRSDELEFFFNRIKDKDFLEYFDTIHIKRIYELQNHINWFEEHVNHRGLRIDYLENENRVLNEELENNKILLQEMQFEIQSTQQHARNLEFEIQSAQQHSSNLENVLIDIKDSYTFRVSSFFAKRLSFLKRITLSFKNRR